MDARNPPPPPELAALIRDALRAALHEDVARIPDICTGEAERLLRGSLAGGCSSRARAVELLAADALLTYAFEAAADTPDTLDARADAAMKRIAAVGDSAVRQSAPCG